MTRHPAFPSIVLALSIVGGSSCYAQNAYFQAASISPSQFFAALKEVSLDLESDPSLARFISLAEQRGDVERALGSYGITVRPNAPVTLVVLVTNTEPVIEARNSTTNSVEERTVVHGIYISTRFFTKAAALRNGKLHPVRAAFGTAWSGSTQAEDNGFRKAIFGDHTQQDIKNRFARIFGECLMAVSSNSAADAPPWPVSSWTDKAKTAADAEFAKIMSPATPVDRSPFEGVSVAPEIALNPDFNIDDCKADPNWHGEWTRVFQRLRWTDPQQPPSLTLNHYFSCKFAYGLAAPRYYAISDRIYLTEENLVFELNGKAFRKRGELTSSHHETLAIGSDAGDPTNERMNAFLSRNITDFLTDLVLGNGPMSGAAPAGPQSASSGVSQGGGTQEDFGAVLNDALFGPGAQRPRVSGRFDWLRVCVPPAVVKEGSWTNPSDPGTPALKNAIRQFIGSHNFGGLDDGRAKLRITQVANRFVVEQVKDCGDDSEFNLQAGRFDALTPSTQPRAANQVGPQGQGQASLRQGVRQDVAAFVEASKNGFNAYKKGEPQLSQGLRMWESNTKPASAKNCWVVQGDTSTTLSCLLSTSTDLNAIRSSYAQLTEDVTASLPAGWSPLAAPAFGPEFPASKGYRASSGAHGEIWIAHAASGEYELHYQFVTAEHAARPAVNPAPPAADDDPIGSGGFITPPSR